MYVIMDGGQQALPGQAKLLTLMQRRRLSGQQVEEQGSDAGPLQRLGHGAVARAAPATAAAMGEQHQGRCRLGQCQIPLQVAAGRRDAHLVGKSAGSHRRGGDGMEGSGAGSARCPEALPRQPGHGRSGATAAITRQSRSALLLPRGPIQLGSAI